MAALAAALVASGLTAGGRDAGATAVAGVTLTRPGDGHGSGSTFAVPGRESPTTTAAPTTTTTTTTPPEPEPEPEPPAPEPDPPAPRSTADEVRARIPDGITAVVPGWTVVWEASRPGYLAATYPGPHTIVIYVRPGRSAAAIAFDLAHEYGHAMDFDRLTPAIRAAWSARRGFGGRSWYGCDMCSDFATPAGDWAESVAVCLTGDRGTFRSQLAALPTSADCEWIRSTVGRW